MKTKNLDDKQAILYFKTIKIFPFLGILSIVLGFLSGIYYYVKTNNPLTVFLASGVGIVIYATFSYRYRCPNCKYHLAFKKNEIKEMDNRCPKCKIKLKEK